MFVVVVVVKKTIGTQEPQNANVNPFVSEFLVQTGISRRTDAIHKKESLRT